MYILAKNVKIGDNLQYKVKDKLKQGIVIDCQKTWDDIYMGGRETEFTILFNNKDKILVEWDEKFLIVSV
tara:strand:+ start:266 stop:475 length:210 start_codon:yes stop_codon:yes gene_type:complete